MNSINIRVQFSGPLLANIEITLNNLKGLPVLAINLEHPILSLLRLAQQNGITNFSSKHFDNDNNNFTELASIAQNFEAQNDEEKEKRVVQIIKCLGQIPEFVQQIENGLDHSSPTLCEEGVNGTYFLKDQNGDIKGVFKPEDEEVSSANNPKNNEDRDAKAESLVGILPGEASKREVASFMLDREGFFGVPRTVLAKIEHSNFQNGTSKVGSLQEFVESDGASWDIGPGRFPVKEVHKIGILDLYTMNLDRHGGNILYREEDGNTKLIPIDNGFSLPDTVAIPDLWFEWMNWTQSKKPFDAETLAFIERLNVSQDIQMLKTQLSIRSECLRVMKITSTLLKKAAAAGMSLHAIGSIVCPGPDGASELQHLVDSVLASMSVQTICDLTEEQEDVFFAQFNLAVDQLIAAKAN